MCLILLSLGVDPDYPLIVAANRDESYARPTAPAYWDGDLLAGRDLVAGGTWMGVTRSGRWAALTNHRDGTTGQRSRGELVLRYLKGQPLDLEGDYAGFHLLLGEGANVSYRSNRHPSRELKRGIHGLSNATLDTPWPKVRRGCQALEGAHDEEALFAILRDETAAADEDLPDTGVGVELERALSPMFIRTPTYGTRCSTVLRLRRDGRWSFAERRYPEGETVACVFPE